MAGREEGGEEGERERKGGKMLTVKAKRRIHRCSWMVLSTFTLENDKRYGEIVKCIHMKIKNKDTEDWRQRSQPEGLPMTKDRTVWV